MNVEYYTCLCRQFGEVGEVGEVGEFGEFVEFVSGISELSCTCIEMQFVCMYADKSWLMALPFD